MALILPSSGHHHPQHEGDADTKADFHPLQLSSLELVPGSIPLHSSWLNKWSDQMGKGATAGGGSVGKGSSAQDWSATTSSWQAEGKQERRSCQLQVSLCLPGRPRLLRPHPGANSQFCPEKGESIPGPKIAALLTLRFSV